MQLNDRSPVKLNNNQEDIRCTIQVKERQEEVKKTQKKTKTNVGNLMQMCQIELAWNLRGSVVPSVSPMRGPYCMKNFSRSRMNTCNANLPLLFKLVQPPPHPRPSPQKSAHKQTELPRPRISVCHPTWLNVAVLRAKQTFRTTPAAVSGPIWNCSTEHAAQARCPFN